MISLNFSRGMFPYLLYIQPYKRILNTITTAAICVWLFVEDNVAMLQHAFK